MQGAIHISRQTLDTSINSSFGGKLTHYKLKNENLNVTLFGGNATLNNTDGSIKSGAPMQLGVDLRISLYSIIFVLSVIGNLLVILTLVQNRRMRTVTNVFLLNLAVSDLLLAVFCMPFTLIPTLLQNFIFGQFMCIIIRYLQGVCVAVSVFTLVSMSLERYFAICQPLRSRTWQTISHSYRMIAIVWALSFIIMIPIAVFQKLIRIGKDSHKCLEVWNTQTSEMIYTLFLDLVLLIGPLFLMLLAYSKISWTLWKGIKIEINNTQELHRLKNFVDGNQAEHNKSFNKEHTTERTSVKTKTKKSPVMDIKSNNSFTFSTKQRNLQRQKLRQSNTARSLAAKKRVIRMLFVLVLEFFVCWTPMYILQTWFVFDHKSATNTISPVTMNFIHLLSYVSSCCNPITYCFMNEKFRQGFLDVFKCCRRDPRPLGRRTSDNTCYSQRTGMQSGKHEEQKRLLSVFRMKDPSYHVCAVNSYDGRNCQSDSSLV